MNDVLLFLQEMEKRMNERLDQFENRLNKLDKKMDDVENRLDDIEKSLSEKINQVWTAVQELREEIDIHQQNKIEALSKRLFHTEVDVVKVEKNMKKLQERTDLLESKVS